MDTLRKVEIATAILKQILKKRRLVTNKAFERELLNMAQKAGIPPREAEIFIEIMKSEIMGY